jgi:hypothetical protein
MPRRMLQTAPLGFAVNGGFGSFADLLFIQSYPIT